MAKQESILVVDDEAEIADLVALYLGNEDYRVIKCGTGAQALAAVDKEKLDLAILDVMLPDIDGFTNPFHTLELLARVKAQLLRFTTYNPGQK